jgi:hypothetical protein
MFFLPSKFSNKNVLISIIATKKPFHCLKYLMYAFFYIFIKKTWHENYLVNAPNSNISILKY